MKRLSFILIFCLSLQVSYGVKVKDVAHLKGMRDFQVTGFGLVVGLRNTGDGPRTLFTTKGMVNMLRNMGIEVDDARVRMRNVAAVMVSANIPPFLKRGSELDVVVSSIGDARSLEGGTLLMTSLNGPDGKVYALAQGPLSIGGYNIEGRAGKAAARKNHALVGQVPSGGILQEEIRHPSIPQNLVHFVLKDPDFSTAVNMVKALNKSLGSAVASAQSAGMVQVSFPEAYVNKPLEFLAAIENVEFSPAEVAKVVLNEKTGTIVAGGNISISSVAISHGNITISINEETEQQNQLAQAPGVQNQTNTETTKEEINVEEPVAEVKVMPEITNVSELAAALNDLGVAPRDIISIFQSLKKAGALHAELITM